MTTRTWPYGTRYKVRILQNSIVQHKGSLVNVITAVCEEIKEGFIIVNRKGDPSPGQGTEVTIEFTQGGPTGGHWKIIE